MSTRRERANRASPPRDCSGRPERPNLAMGRTAGRIERNLGVVETNGDEVAAPSVSPITASQVSPGWYPGQSRLQRLSGETCHEFRELRRMARGRMERLLRVRALSQHPSCSFVSIRDIRGGTISTTTRCDCRGCDQSPTCQRFTAQEEATLIHTPAQRTLLEKEAFPGVPLPQIRFDVANHPVIGLRLIAHHK